MEDKIFIYQGKVGKYKIGGTVEAKSSTAAQRLLKKENPGIYSLKVEPWPGGKGYKSAICSIWLPESNVEAFGEWAGRPGKGGG